MPSDCERAECEVPGVKASIIDYDDGETVITINRTPRRRDVLKIIVNGETILDRETTT